MPGKTKNLLWGLSPYCTIVRPRPPHFRSLSLHKVSSTYHLLRGVVFVNTDLGEAKQTVFGSFCLRGMALCTYFINPVKSEAKTKAALVNLSVFCLWRCRALRSDKSCARPTLCEHPSRKHNTHAYISLYLSLYMCIYMLQTVHANALKANAAGEGANPAAEEMLRNAKEQAEKALLETKVQPVPTSIRIYIHI